MIRAEFTYAEDGKAIVLNVNGHAGQNEVGKDIICSASSILAFTVAQVVTDCFRDHKLRKKPTVKLQEGNATIVVKPLKDNFDEVLHTFYVAETGYNLLATNYPKYVRLTKFDRG